MIRFFAFSFVSLFAISAQAESEALLKDKTQYLHNLKLGACRFEVVPQSDKRPSVEVNVWVNGKPSWVLYSGEGSGSSYAQVNAQFYLDRASWRNGHWTNGLSKLTLYSSYTNGSSTSGFNRKWIEAWYGPKGDIVHVRLTSRRNGPTLLGLITSTSYTIDCKN